MMDRAGLKAEQVKPYQQTLATTTCIDPGGVMVNRNLTCL